MHCGIAKGEIDALWDTSHLTAIPQCIKSVIFCYMESTLLPWLILDGDNPINPMIPYTKHVILTHEINTNSGCSESRVQINKL